MGLAKYHRFINDIRPCNINSGFIDIQALFDSIKLITITELS